MSTAYLGNPRVLGTLGLAPKEIQTPVIEADLLWPRIGRAPDQIRYQPGEVSAPGTLPPLDPLGPVAPAYQERKA